MQVGEFPKECVGHAEAGARVCLFGCGLSRERFGADKNLREFELIDCFSKEQYCGA
jgi:hypothetical protein